MSNHAHAWLNEMKGYNGVFAGHVDTPLVIATKNDELTQFEIRVQEQDTVTVPTRHVESDYGWSYRFEFVVDCQTFEGFYSQKLNGKYSIGLYKRDRVDTKELKALLAK